MNFRSLVRPLMAAAAIAAAVALAGCETDGNGPSLRSLQPLSPQMISLLEQKHMAKESPILVRIFKEEAELEVWKQDDTGRMALLKTYPICRWSGELGPKVKEGDRQAPEGFYTITPSLMNPNSNYYLAINIGFPNAYDRANHRTGAFLMIHGDCSSSGCYAMTDEQIAEIYALARESFFGGQASFQIEAFPFRMTPENMARHRNSPHMRFWRMLKVGYDHFEVTRQPPKVNVCERRYVFDAESKGRFNPSGPCPAMKVPDDVVAAVREKEHQDELRTAQLIRQGTPVVAVKTHTDGGMNPAFRAAVKPYEVDENGVLRTRIATSKGTIPANIRLPGTPRPANTTGSISEPVVAVAKPSRRGKQQPDGAGNRSLFASLFTSEDGSGSAASSNSNSGGVFSRMSRLMGWNKASKAEKKAPTSKARPSHSRSHAKRTASRRKPASQTAAKSRPKPAAESGTRTANAAPTAAASASLISGAQPTLPAGSFENRFGAWH